MKRYHFPDGRTFEHGVGFTLGDFKYPPNWLELATPDDLSSRNITSEDVVIEGPTLDQVKASLKTQVDTDAERCRLQFITAGAGQMGTYQEKHQQAQAVEDLGEEAANALTLQEAVEEYPSLAAGLGIAADIADTIGADVNTLWGCSQVVIAMAEMWQLKAGAIERARLLGKQLISDASDAASARAAYEGITWPSP